MTTNGINSQIEMNNETNVTVDSPPTPITADYIEMIFLTIMISIGVPLNVYVLTTLCHQYQSAPKNGLKAAYILMKININLSDLVLLLGYCLGKLLWMATYSWEGGDALCKIYEFVVMFGLYLSSNMVISISIDRLKNVLSAKKIRGDVMFQTRFLLITSWITAAILATPQLFAWGTMDVFPDWPGGWIQCFLHWEGKTADMYNAFHIFFVFWLSFIVITIVYAVIALKLLRLSMASPTSTIGRIVTDTASAVVTEPLISAKCRATDSEIKTPGATNLNLLMMVAPGQTLTLPLNGKDEQSAVDFDENDDLTPSNCDLPTRVPHENNIPHERNSKITIMQNIFHRICSTFKTKTSNRPRASIALELESPTEFGRFESSRSTIVVNPRERVKVPVWRRQLRSRVFRTTLLVVITHVLCWLPYNVLVICKYILSDAEYNQLSDHVNIFKALQVIITLINPFIYGL